MPNHHLILILGKGQTVLNPEFGKNTEKPFIQPIISKQAMLHRLLEMQLLTNPAQKYTHVHILGTKNSIWDTLFDEIAAESLNNEILEKAEKLAYVIKEETTSPEDLVEVSETLRETHGVKVFSYIIPVSENDDDSMAIFNKIMELNEIEEKDTISIDITHGLRYQPLFLLTGFEYFSKLKKVKMGDIFYGALELSNFNVDEAAITKKQGKIDLSEIKLNTRGSGSPKKDSISLAEIQSFKIINKMFEAINAANLFVKIW
ncbi:MAG: CRISPR-associated DxTHG motif protein [Ignavibacteriales bacterium]|nr:CRISPR-associated DxTHG motif protein [Ignavibacteriales bacterium]